MVYAYDKWAELPVRDLYDSQMMATAINAAKDMYDRGLQAIKDFRKDYGDFNSPFAKDMAAYGDMVGGVRNIINDAATQGIDLFKSPEGRMLISRAVNSVDPSIYNKMKANAKVGYSYLDAMQKLILLGKYDPEMAAAWLEDNGLGSFENFSTIGDNGVINSWNMSSPIQGITLEDLTSSGFLGRTPHELTKEDAKRLMGMSYDPRARYTGWIDRDQLGVATGLIPGLMGDWRAQYYRKRSADALGLDVNSSDQDIQSAIDAKFAQDIADANRKWLVEPTGDLSDYYKQRDYGLKLLQMQQNQKNADRQFALDLAKNGIHIDPTTGRFVKAGQESDYIQPFDQRRLDKQVNSRANALANYQNVFTEAIRVQQDIIDKYNKEKTASTLGYIESGGSNKMTYAGTASYGAPVLYIDNRVKRTPYAKNKNSEEQLAKMEQRAKVARQNIKVFESVLKLGPRQLVALGYLDETGVPTDKYNNLLSRTLLKNPYNKSKESKQQAIDYLYDNLYSAGDLAEGDFRDYMTRNFGGDKEGIIPGIEGKYKITNTGKYTYTPVHRANLFGQKLYNQDSMEQRFNGWLGDDKQAWVWNDDMIQDAFVGTKTGESYEQSGTILIKKEDLADFATKYGYNVDKVAKELKLKSQIVKTAGGNDVEHWYYEVPVTTGFSNNGGFNYYRGNEQVNKKDFGSAQNTKDRMDAQRQSVMN